MVDASERENIPSTNIVETQPAPLLVLDGQTVADITEGVKKLAHLAIARAQSGPQAREVVQKTAEIIQRLQSE